VVLTNGGFRRGLDRDVGGGAMPFKYAAPYRRVRPDRGQRTYCGRVARDDETSRDVRIVM
jgi:hypothetical protein